MRSAAERRDAYDVVRGEVEAGRQAFVVCAAIDEGNRTQVKAAEAEAERLRRRSSPTSGRRCCTGGCARRTRRRAWRSSAAGEADVLISTTVIEVGVDVPNATVMLVENAERFGLAQLHQLRGRIGRGEHASFCFLFDDAKADNVEARARLDAMARTTDGFELADEDLRLRGEGTLFDTRQSGMPDLKLARLAEDLELVRRARSRAFAQIDADPDLQAHPELLAELEPASSARSSGCSGPDRPSTWTGPIGSLHREDHRRYRQGDAAGAGARRHPPVSDRAREGLFSSLGARSRAPTCLDLFAGTGALGIEALSRGAATATFVDRDRAPPRRSATTCPDAARGRPRS